MSDVCELSKIAALFRVTEKAVRDWIGAGMPVVERGTQGGQRKKTRISLRAAVAWYFETNFERLELERRRADLAREQARKVAIENAQRMQDLAPISVLERQFADAVAVAQALLLAIPHKEAPMLAPLSDANAIKQRLTAAIHDALHDLAAYGRRGRRETSRGRRGARNGSVRTAARSNGKRVGGGEETAQ